MMKKKKAIMIILLWLFVVALFHRSDYIIRKFVVLCTGNSQAWYTLQKVETDEPVSCCKEAFHICIRL